MGLLLSTHVDNDQRAAMFHREDSRPSPILHSRSRIPRRQGFGEDVGTPIVCPSERACGSVEDPIAAYLANTIVGASRDDLVEAITAALATFVSRLRESHAVVLPANWLWSRVKTEFPELDEDPASLAAVGDRVMELLDGLIQDARSQNPGKPVRIRFHSSPSVSTEESAGPAGSFC